jgi:hypothetical protein
VVSVRVNKINMKIIENLMFTDISNQVHRHLKPGSQVSRKQKALFYHVFSYVHRYLKPGSQVSQTRFTGISNQVHRYLKPGSCILGASSSSSTSSLLNS